MVMRDDGKRKKKMSDGAGDGGDYKGDAVWQHITEQPAAEGAAADST